MVQNFPAGNLTFLAIFLYVPYLQASPFFTTVIKTGDVFLRLDL